MTERYVRQCAIDDPVCPICLQSGLGGELTSKSFSTYLDEETGKQTTDPIKWWKSTCSNCRSIVERHLLAYQSFGLLISKSISTITEEITPSNHGLVIRENRELKALLEKTGMRIES